LAVDYGAVSRAVYQSHPLAFFRRVVHALHEEVVGLVDLMFFHLQYATIPAFKKNKNN
jgi:hypothetical protein